MTTHPPPAVEPHRPPDRAGGGGIMHTDLVLGRVRGVEIGVSWTWLIVVALITWSLAASVFPTTNPRLGSGVYAAMGVAAALLFFTSLLLHELGHAIQARREGMEIGGITLWVFGGVARFKGMFPSAGAEFRIAIAGPLVTLVIGAVCLAAAAALPLPDAVDGVVSWLGRINLFLLVFNLLPALPLDGGRVLRAALWQYRGDLAWATLIAGQLGRICGQIMIGGGIFLLFFGGYGGGLWLALIGWFLVAAAGAESSVIAAREALRGLRVEHAMALHPECVDPDETLAQVAARVLSRSRHASYPVLEDDRPVGLLMFRSVASVPERDRGSLRVRDRMIPAPDALVLDADEELPEALSALLDTQERRALVVRDGELAGLLSISDLQRVLELRRPRGAARRR